MLAASSLRFEAPHAPLCIIHAAFGDLHINESWGSLRPSSLQRTSKYASFLRTCAPCIWAFFLCRHILELLTSPSNLILSLLGFRDLNLGPFLLLVFGQDNLCGTLLFIDDDVHHLPFGHGHLVHLRIIPFQLFLVKSR